MGDRELATVASHAVLLCTGEEARWADCTPSQCKQRVQRRSMESPLNSSVDRSVQWLVAL